MSYQRLRCPKGHTFMHYVVTRNQRVACPYCTTTRSYDPSAANPNQTDDSSVFSIDLPTLDPTPSPASDDSFSSGGGGDFGGGGSSGAWGSD